MKYKFENLEVWKLSIQLQDLVYEIVEMLPEFEKFNLTSQMRRASTSVILNIAEGSTSVSNAEQLRFLSYSIRWRRRAKRILLQPSLNSIGKTN